MDDGHHEHDHDGHREHDHDGHDKIVATAELGSLAIRIRAIAELLVEKEIVTRQELQAQLDNPSQPTPYLGARLVARAWVDPEFKRRLLEDPKAACLEALGFEFGAAHLVVPENTDRVHNLVVCTLCSCYPMPILGRSPDWYKSLNYRSRAVQEPREVLREFGVELGDDVEVRVWDSTADVRYLVLPQRPAGTEHLSEVELAQLVTRDSMIGTDVLSSEPASVVR